MGSVSTNCPKCDGHKGYEFAEPFESVLVKSDVDSLVEKWQDDPNKKECIDDLLALYNEPKE